MQALIHGWTHVNSRAFALEYIMRDLAIFSALALVAVLGMRRVAISRRKIANEGRGFMKAASSVN